MKQDKFMLILTIAIFIAIVIKFADQIAHKKDYERCIKKEMEFCSSAKLMHHKECYNYAQDKCDDI